MKKNQIFVVLCTVVIATMAFVAAKSFVGHWNVTYGNGEKGHVVFRKDGTNEATFDHSTWKVGGQYRVEGSTMSIADSSCGLGYWGTYKSNWYSEDSVRMSLVSDTCTGRKTSVDGAVLVRAK